MESKEVKIIESAKRLFVKHGYQKVTMSDIAEAAEMSRPSLYSAFSNKEDVFSAILYKQESDFKTETSIHLAQKKSVQAKLEFIFDLWILKPVASVVDSENGRDLIANCAKYAPAATASMYAQFEQHLFEVLDPEIKRKKPLSAKDLAHLLMLATKGLKASTPAFSELERLVDGLIAMTLSAIK